MKKLFVSLLAIAGVVACTNDEVVSVQQGNPIAFDTFVENTTRVGYASNNLPEGFNVWAFMENANGRSTILEAEDVRRQGDQYVYDNTQYWVPDNTYYFAALAPMDSQNVTNLVLATGDAAKKGLGTFDFENKNGTEDLIYAVNMVEANDQQGAVTFTFNHLLSKVKFSFTNTFDNENYSIKVRNIQMTAPKIGTIDLTAGEYVWTDLAEETTLVYGDVTAIAAMNDTVCPEDERLTIPAGDTQEYIVTFDVELYVGSTLAKTYNKKSEISGIALEAGKAYNFAANIDADSLNLDEVVFDANVDEWVEDTGAPQFTPYTVEVDGVNYDNLAEAVVKAMEFNKPVKFFQHVAIDADTTITVPADKTLALELNGYTLTGVTDQTGSNRNMFDVRGTMTVDGTPLTRAADGNGCINIKHIGANMGWNASTNVFNVTAGGVLNLENVTAKNLGGSDMAFVAHLNNWGEVTLNVENCTLESNYVPVRVFNSGYDMNNVTIKNSTLKGGSAAFWVHNYTVEDFGSEAKAEAQKALLNFDIYNGTNTFSPDINGIRYGMTNSVRADSYGITKVVSEDGTEVTLGSMTDNGVVRRYVAGDENNVIKKVIVGEGITTLENRTFRKFHALEEVVLPSTLETIGVDGKGNNDTTGTAVFQGCENLKYIVIPESVTTIDKGAFYGCSSLESINIPAGVTRIEESSLRATGLVSVEFHKGVTYFGAQAFRDCKQLKEVFINAPNFTIEANAFGSMAAPYPAVTIYVANAEMKAYLESTLAYKDQFKVVAPNDVVSADDELSDAVSNAQSGDVIYVEAGDYTSFPSSVAAGVTIKCEEGTVFNGTSSLNINGSTVIGATFQSGSNNLVANSSTINGTFKNCVFNGDLKFSNAGDTVVFENCVFNGPDYALHFDTAVANSHVILKGCEVNSEWRVAIGAAVSMFEAIDTKFNVAGFINLWGKAKFTDCAFNKPYHWICCMDTTEFTNCTCEGRALVANDIRIEDTVITINNELFTSSNEGLKFALENNASIVNLVAGNYELSGLNFVANNVTLKGVDKANVVLNLEKSIYLQDKSVTLENLTYNLNAGKDYTEQAFAFVHHATAFNLKNCNVNRLRLNVYESNIEDCTFTLNTSSGFDGYCIYYYGNDNSTVNVKNSTFATAGKGICIYSEHAKAYNLNVDKCSFTSSDSATDKAAIQMHTELGISGNVKITETTAAGFANINGGLWNELNNNTKVATDIFDIWVDGTQVH